MNYSGDEIIQIAIGEEKDAIEFYKIALDNSESSDAKEIFHFLLHEEERHLALLEKEILPRFSEPSFSWEDEGMIASYLEDTGKSGMFKKEAGAAEKFARTHQNALEVVEFAINMEKKAIEFYKKVQAASSSKTSSEALDLVIHEEAGHIHKLNEIRKTIENT